MITHKLSYIICATPRSGSTLLCDLLTDTGMAGRPDSFFNFDSFDWPDYFNVSTLGWGDKHEFDQTYLSAVLEFGSNNTTVFGLRLMWETLDVLLEQLEVLYPDLDNDKDRFRSAFGDCVYLHLTREDKVAQAVSNLKAEQTGLWHAWDDGSERERLKPAATPIYDGQALRELVATAQEHEKAWIDWFSQHDIVPVGLSYESLAAYPQRTLATILTVLDLDPAGAQNIKPKSAKLADRQSDEWIARFRKESEQLR